MKWTHIVALAAALGMTAVGCGSDDSSQEPLEISGEWTSEFGDETISSTSWTDQFGSSSIVDYDNEDNVVIRESAGEDQAASAFSKIVFTDPDDDSFYFCIVAFDLESLAEAQASEATADATDLDGKGCGGAFPWSKLTKK
jgi:hypothetical protein